MKRSFQKGNHLWAIESVGKRVTTTWGVVGRKPQSKSAAHGSINAALWELHAQARLKLRAGYAETTFRGDLPLAHPTAEGLIEALTENPDDLAAHMAFADWLSEQADDRLTAWGEFMRLQLAQEQTPPVGKRKTPDMRRIEELRGDFEMHWLGEKLAIPLLGLGTEDLRNRSRYAHDTQTRRYVRGWLDSLTMFGLDKELARAMAGSKALRLLRTLEISELEGDYEDGSLAVLAKSTVLANVRHLRFIAYGPDSGLTSLIRSMPQLKSLRLAVDGLEPGSLFAMPSLASLHTLEVIGPVRFQLEKLAANPAMGHLRRLALNMAADSDDIFDEPEEYLSDDEIHAICYAPYLTGLKELALHWVETTDDDAWRPFAESGILARLDLLDLTRSNLHDRSVEILAASPDFARIPRVILDENYLEPLTVRRLRQINKGVEAHDQRDDFDEYDDIDNDFDDDWE